MCLWHKLVRRGLLFCTRQAETMTEKVSCLLATSEDLTALCVTLKKAVTVLYMLGLPYRSGQTWDISALIGAWGEGMSLPKLNLRSSNLCSTL